MAQGHLCSVSTRRGSITVQWLGTQSCSCQSHSSDSRLHVAQLSQGTEVRCSEWPKSVIGEVPRERVGSRDTGSAARGLSPARSSRSAPVRSSRSAPATQVTIISSHLIKQTLLHNSFMCKFIDIFVSQQFCKLISPCNLCYI